MPKHNTVGIINKLVMVFAFTSAIYFNQQYG